MKSLKKYTIISLAGLAMLVLGGCQTNKQIQEQNEQNLMNQTQEQAANIDPMTNVNEVTGNDSASKAVNDIDSLLNDSDTDDMSGDTLTDKSLDL